MKRQAGQSLVEMIVIIGVVVLLVTGIVAGTTASLSRTEMSRRRSEALSFAQAGIELTREKRDSGWNTFMGMGSAGGTVYCVGDWTSGPCSPNIDNTFTRSVTLQYSADSGMKVTSRVVWGDVANPVNAVWLTTYLTEWK